MAGIGFELQRVLKRGGIGSFFKVILAGSIVVAGPWILTILGIFFIGRYAEVSLGTYRNFFTGAVVYCYAFSLIIFGGTHYIFTRYVADLIYEEKNREAGSALISFSALVVFLAIVIAGIAVHWISLSSSRVEVVIYKVSFVLLFVFVNLIWLLMIFISLIKQFMAIFILYLVGMVISFLGVRFLGSYYRTGGALLGYVLGQGFIVVSLFILVTFQYKPKGFSLGELLRYIGRYKFLLLTGILYYWGMWADKIIFKIGFGRVVPGSFFQIFDYYDIPVYVANLTIIPGMIYYITVTEIIFYIKLKEFLKGLHENPYDRILKKKYEMIHAIKYGLREQAIFQGMFIIVIGLLANGISTLLFGGTLSVEVFRVVLAGVFFHFMLLTLIIYLFYLEFYAYAFVSALIFFMVNFGFSLIITFRDWTSLFGYSYLFAGMLGSVTAFLLLSYSVRYVERDLYARQIS